MVYNGKISHILANKQYKRGLFVIIKKVSVLLIFVAGFCFWIGCALFETKRLQKVSANITKNNAKEKICVVIDPGHGGIDSGKVGVSGVKEKDINLAIALMLKRNLEQMDIQVIMTRTDDQGLYSAQSKNKKREDMQARMKCINDSNADCVVSIHQNSFGDSKYGGAQTFYYKNSKEGELLAQTIQTYIISMVQPENKRHIKENGDYYILKYSKIPAVIVECVFLSNPKEELLISDQNYQEKMAWAITHGLLKYMKGNK